MTTDPLLFASLAILFITFWELVPRPLLFGRDDKHSAKCRLCEAPTDGIGELCPGCRNRRVQ